MLKVVVAIPPENVTWRTGQVTQNQTTHARLECDDEVANSVTFFNCSSGFEVMVPVTLVHAKVETRVKSDVMSKSAQHALSAVSQG